MTSTDTMYHVIARDGRQYGPLGTAVVEEWLLNERLALDSLAWTAGQSDWRPLLQLVHRQQMPVRSASSEEQTFLGGLSKLLEQRSYEIGPPADGVDSRTSALGLKAGAAITKFAIGFLTKQRVYGSVTVKGAAASQAEMNDVVSRVIVLSDLFAFRNDLSHGTGAVLAVLSDSFSTTELLARVELLKQECQSLRQFAMELNGERSIIIQSVMVYTDSVTFEAHRKVLPLVGYKCLHDRTGWTTSLVSVVDLNRQIVDYSMMKGFWGGLQRVTGLRPFGPQDLTAALALAPRP